MLVNRHGSVKRTRYTELKAAEHGDKRYLTTYLQKAQSVEPATGVKNIKLKPQQLDTRRITNKRKLNQREIEEISGDNLADGSVDGNTIPH